MKAREDKYRCFIIIVHELFMRHIWYVHIPNVPHKELVNYYNEASVFVFPSLDEGMALVQLEALACGVPVICTPNSGGDSVVEEGREGFVVPIRNSTLLASRLRSLLEDPNLVKQMAE